jgi:hypothetical protein
MFIVGGRLYSMSDKEADSTKLLRTLKATSAWKQVSNTSGTSKNNDDLSDLRDECFWSYFSPDGSMICFYASKSLPSCTMFKPVVYAGATNTKGAKLSTTEIVSLCFTQIFQ